jgi:hypothetical protein
MDQPLLRIPQIDTTQEEIDNQVQNTVDQYTFDDQTHMVMNKPTGDSREHQIELDLPVDLQQIDSEEIIEGEETNDNHQFHQGTSSSEHIDQSMVPPGGLNTNQIQSILDQFKPPRIEDSFAIGDNNETVYPRSTTSTGGAQGDVIEILSSDDEEVQQQMDDGSDDNMDENSDGVSEDVEEDAEQNSAENSENNFAENSDEINSSGENSAENVEEDLYSGVDEVEAEEEAYILRTEVESDDVQVAQNIDYSENASEIEEINDGFSGNVENTTDQEFLPTTNQLDEHITFTPVDLQIEQDEDQQFTPDFNAHATPEAETYETVELDIPVAEFSAPTIEQETPVAAVESRTNETEEMEVDTVEDDQMEIIDDIEPEVGSGGETPVYEGVENVQENVELENFESDNVEPENLEIEIGANLNNSNNFDDTWDQTRMFIPDETYLAPKSNEKHMDKLDEIEENEETFVTAENELEAEISSKDETELITNETSIEKTSEDAKIDKTCDENVETTEAESVEEIMAESTAESTTEKSTVENSIAEENTTEEKTTEETTTDEKTPENNETELEERIESLQYDHDSWKKETSLSNYYSTVCEYYHISNNEGSYHAKSYLKKALKKLDTVQLDQEIQLRLSRGEEINSGLNRTDNEDRLTEMIASEHFYREQMNAMEDVDLQLEARRFCLSAGGKKIPKAGYAKSRRTNLIKTIIQTKRNQQRAMSASPTSGGISYSQFRTDEKNFVIQENDEIKVDNEMAENVQESKKSGSCKSYKSTTSNKLSHKSNKSANSHKSGDSRSRKTSMNSDVTKYDAMEISIQTSLLEKERLHDEEEEEEEDADDHMDEGDELGETQDDTILAQVDPNLETILEEGNNSVRKSRDTSPVGSVAMSTRSRGSQRSTRSMGSRMSVGSRRSMGSRMSESQNSELWGETEKSLATALREEIKMFDSTYRGHIRNQKQYKNAQEHLEKLKSTAQVSQQTEARSSRRGRNPSNTQSTSSSTSRSKTRTTQQESQQSSVSNSTSKSKKSSQKKPEKTKESVIEISSEQVSELDNKGFRAFWKENGFNETIKKLTAGNLATGSATRKVFEKKMWAHLEK